MKKHYHIPLPLQPVQGLLLTALFMLCLNSPGETYTVKKGDTLSAIAKKHGVSAADLTIANSIRNVKRIQIGQVLTIPNPDAPLEYLVRSGDTLDGIARQHRTTAAELKQYNRLQNPDRLFVGQKILIPGGAGITSSQLPSANRALLPATFRRELNRIPVRTGKWRYIVIHHSASDAGTMKGMDRYHREERRMQNGLAYHFVIGNGKGMTNGEIGIGNRWKKQIQGGHLASEKLNQVAIGICLVGNFEKQTPNSSQLRSLEALLGDLLNRTSLPPSAVRTHRAINNRPTRCPGRKFPIALVKSKF
jgi:LysM repeat protein